LKVDYCHDVRCTLTGTKFLSVQVTVPRKTWRDLQEEHKIGPSVLICRLSIPQHTRWKSSHVVTMRGLPARNVSPSIPVRNPRPIHPHVPIRGLGCSGRSIPARSIVRTRDVEKNVHLCDQQDPQYRESRPNGGREITSENNSSIFLPEAITTWNYIVFAPAGNCFVLNNPPLFAQTNVLWNTQRKGRRASDRKYIWFVRRV